MKRLALLIPLASLLFGSSLIGETNTAELTSGYNSPARIDVKGSWDLFFTASCLYWQAREDGLSPGDDYPFSTTLAESVYNMPFEFKPGFKVGIGSNLDHDNWISHFEYTRLHVEDHGHFHSNNTVYPYWVLYNTVDRDPIYNAEASWKLHYDMMDLKIARPLYEGTKLTILPFGGIRGGWINQSYSVGYEFESTLPYYYTTARTNSWVVGPRIGIEADCLLGAGFRLFGDTSFSLLYQRQKTAIRVPNYYYGTALYNETEGNSQLTPNFDLTAGFGWGRYFDKDNWHVDFSAAYDFHYYFEQNRMKRVFDEISNSPSVVGKAKDLILQGLTVTLRFDF
jgi:hypothetical protein